MDLNVREKRILSAVIEGYIETAEPVGSGFVSECSSTPVCPATVRKVMYRLEELGLLSKPFTSAGRIPTEAGLRYYVDSILTVPMYSENQRGDIKRRFIEEVRRSDRLVEETTRFLSRVSKQTVIGFFEDDANGDIFVDGRSYLFDNFSSVDLAGLKPFFSVLEDSKAIRALLNVASGSVGTRVLFSSEAQRVSLPPCSIVAAPVQAVHGSSGALAILGPHRIRYGEIIGLVDYTSSLLVTEIRERRGINP